MPQAYDTLVLLPDHLAHILILTDQLEGNKSVQAQDTSGSAAIQQLSKLRSCIRCRAAAAPAFCAAQCCTSYSRPWVFIHMV